MAFDIVIHVCAFIDVYCVMLHSATLDYRFAVLCYMLWYYFRHCMLYYITRFTSN